MRISTPGVGKKKKRAGQALEFLTVYDLITIGGILGRRTSFRTVFRSR